VHSEVRCWTFNSAGYDYGHLNAHTIKVKLTGKRTSNFIKQNAKQLPPAIREVQQEFINAMQEVSSKFYDKLQRAITDLNYRNYRLEKTLQNNNKKLST
jgi:hypothetical protein